MTIQFERRRLLSLIVTRVVAAPGREMAYEPTIVTLCDESATIIRWLVCGGYHATAEEAIQAALERVMMACRE